MPIKGQDKAIDQLKDAWNKGRFHHAWILSGPKGVGKASLAKYIASFILNGGTDWDFNSQSQASRLVASGAHPDLKIVSKEINPKNGKIREEIVVEQIRDFINFFNLKPAFGGFRVVIIDAAEDMNDKTQNALLKMLEEPPPRSLLLLVSHMPWGLLPTIRSRCRNLGFAPLEVGLLKHLLREKYPEIKEDELKTLSLLSEGSLGGAIALKEQGGMEIYHKIFELLCELPRFNKPFLLDFATNVSKDGESFSLFALLFENWLARLIHFRAGGGTIAETMPGEFALMQGLNLSSIEPVIKLWENNKILLNRTENLYLDKKQVVLNIFGALEQAARG